MSAVLVAALLIAAQASSGHYALAALHSAARVPTVEIPAPSLPQKRGTGIHAAEDFGPQITAQSAAVIDASSGLLLFGKRPYAVRSLASVTKLLTALLLARLEPPWDQLVAVRAADIPPEGHTILRPGDRVTVRDLFTAMLVRSDNGAARALIRSRDAAPDWFPTAARELARSLGMFALDVREPTGLASENRGTAVDAAHLLRAAIAHPEIRDRLRLPTAVLTAYRRAPTRIPLRSTNLLLREGDRHAFDIVGGKTGYLDESGYNLALAVTRGGRDVIVVVLGSASHEDRFRDARILADWTFRNYVWSSSTSSSVSATSASPR